MGMRTDWPVDSIEPQRSKFPRSRRELLSFLWFGLEMHNANIAKEGPEYTAYVGRKVMATRIRSINALTFGEWEKRFRDQYFPL